MNNLLFIKAEVQFVQKWDGYLHNLIHSKAIAFESDSW